MKFGCQKNTLLREISLALDFTSQKNTMSIVSNVLLDTSHNRLTIQATDQKVGFHCMIEVETLEEGTTTVFCDKFLGILRALPDEHIIFEEVDEKLYIHPVNKSIDFELRTIPADKFPALEAFPEDKAFDIPQRDFNDMTDQTIFAISDDETRYFMNGVYLEHEDRSLTMVATDGRRLSLITRSMPGEVAIPSFEPIIIPPKLLAMIKKASLNEGLLTLAVTDTILFAKSGNHTMYTTLIKGTFPNFRRVIPTNQQFSCRMSINEMNEALKRVSLLVENKAKRIYVDIEQHTVTISSEENDFGQAKEIIACDYNGEPCRLAMNYSYLETPLRVMDGEYFSISFTKATMAVTVKPDPEMDYFHIIMPMQVD